MVAYRLRPATPDDSDILFLIHRASMGEYLEQAFGPWTEEFDREQHEQWLSAGRAQVILVGDRDCRGPGRGVDGRRGAAVPDRD